VALKAVLFDLDGTLIDFKIDYTLARDKTISVLENNGYPEGRLNHGMLVLEMVAIAIRYFESQLGYSQKKIGEIKGEVSKAVEKVELLAARKATPHRGIINVLDFLTKNQIAMGILTFNTTQNAKVSIESANLQDYFPYPDLYVGRDIVNNPKPHPDHVNVLLDRLDVSAQDSVLIGDHPRDIESANNVNMRSVALVSRHHTPDSFDSDNVIFARDMSEKLVPILKKMMNGKR